MRTATVQEIRQELKHLSSAELIELLQRLARFKKENKELLTYLLFEAHDEAAFIASVKQLMDEGFAALNSSQVYLAKKTIRKVLRLANKFIRFSGSAVVEAELLIHFCSLLRSSGIRIDRYPVLQHLYDNQRAKAVKAIDSLHEDLQYELHRALG
jgi:hypothetical protein